MCKAGHIYAPHLWTASLSGEGLGSTSTLHPLIEHDLQFSLSGEEAWESQRACSNPSCGPSVVVGLLVSMCLLVKLMLKVSSGPILRGMDKGRVVLGR